VDVAGGGLLDMRDPMSGNPTMVTETGQGVWALGGTNSLTSTAFSVNSGTLYLYAAGEVPNPNPSNSNAQVAAGTIALSGAGSSFTLGSGASLVAAGNNSITVNGPITLANGATIRGGTAADGSLFNVPLPGGGLASSLTLTPAAGTAAGLQGQLAAEAVAPGDTFTLNAALANAPGSTGSLLIPGAGTVILTGVNTYTGPTTVSAGALFVDGSIASSSLTTVNNDAALHGSGTVGSTVINAGGFLVPGPVGTPGSMSVAGNLAFQSGAFYVVQANPSTASTTNVGGTASLAGTVVADFAPGSYVNHGYTILTSEGGRTGTFDALATFGLPADFAGSLHYTANSALLNITAELVPEPNVPPPPPGPIPEIPGGPTLPEQPPAPFFTVNQLNVGHAIDNFFNSGGTLPPAFANLFNLTGTNLTNALTQLSGENATGAERSSFQLTNEFLSLMLDPYVTTTGVAPAQPASPPRAVFKAPVYKAPVPTFEQRWTAWAAGFGGSGTANGNPAIGSNNVTTSTFGYAAGLDYHYSPDTVLGFALAGGGTNWSLAQRLGSGRSDAFMAGVYGITHEGPVYLAGALAFANNWFTTERTALAEPLNASFQGQDYAARLEGGYRFTVPVAYETIGITPYAAIQAQDFHTPFYSETDVTAGGFGLSYDAKNGTDTRSELGGRFDDQTTLNAMPLTLRVRVAWAHDWVSNPALNASFESLPGSSFTVTGAPIPHNSALASASAQLFFTSNWSLLAKFDGEFASGAQIYAGSGTLRYTW
jgi:autotransporter-associated beta strand protein